MHDVLIIGSGVIGMSIARHLSATHLDVAVIDRDVPESMRHIKLAVCLAHKMNLQRIVTCFN